ncbi:beta-1,3-galactosyltransferase brn-like [Haemaphysalis longicornis]
MDERYAVDVRIFREKRVSRARIREILPAFSLLCCFCVACVIAYRNYLDSRLRIGGAVPAISEVPRRQPGWKAAAACRSGFRILYFVHTAPNHTERRDFLRRTIGDPHMEASANTTLVFFVGRVRDPALQAAVEAEAHRHGDVVLLDIVDAYRNLTHKFLHGSRWVIDNCLLDANRAIVKLDDDTLVNVEALVNHVNRMPERPPQIHCLLYNNVSALRNRSSKWYVTEEEYPNKAYPPYCAGLGYIMTADVLPMLYNASVRVPFFWVDDVYATGMLAAAANVSLVDLRKRRVMGRLKGALRHVPRKALFVHMGNSPKTMGNADKLWEGFFRTERSRPWPDEEDEEMDVDIRRVLRIPGQRFAVVLFYSGKVMRVTLKRLHELLAEYRLVAHRGRDPLPHDSFPDTFVPVMRSMRTHR